jgi:hypothetical protein
VGGATGEEALTETNYGLDDNPGFASLSMGRDHGGFGGGSPAGGGPVMGADRHRPTPGSSTPDKARTFQRS